MIDISTLPLLKGKKALVTGIAPTTNPSPGAAPRPFARSVPTSLLPI